MLRTYIIGLNFNDLGHITYYLQFILDKEENKLLEE